MRGAACGDEAPDQGGADLAFSIFRGGQILTMTHGGLQETRQYNVMQQMTRLTIAGQMDLEYRFPASGNSGQITAMKNWVSGEEVNYTYDALSRLVGRRRLDRSLVQALNGVGYHYQ